MGKFRKKPVVIEAHQWFNHDAILFGGVVGYYDPYDEEGDGKCKQCGKPHSEHGWVETLEGGHIVCPGDWIIKGVRGEFYPCKKDIFEETYEKAE